MGDARFEDVAGARVRVESWGDAALPVVLCLHGLGGGAHFFSALGHALAPRRRLVAFDAPGSGLSRSPGAFSFDEVAGIAVALLRRDGGRGVLVGHSMGTITALEVVRLAPDAVAGAIFAGGLPEPLAPARARIAERAARIRSEGLAGLGDQVVAANFARATRETRPELTGLFARLFELQDAAGYASTAEALAAWTARPLPPLDGIPCLAVTGDEDLYAPPDAVRAFAARLPAGTRVEVMPDCGHLPFLEQPQAFTAIVEAFLHSE